MEVTGTSTYDEWVQMQKKREELMASARPKTAEDAHIISIEDQDEDSNKKVFGHQGMDVVEISSEYQEYLQAHQEE